VDGIHQLGRALPSDVDEGFILGYLIEQRQQPRRPHQALVVPRDLDSSSHSRGTWGKLSTFVTVLFIRSATGALSGIHVIPAVVALQWAVAALATVTFADYWRPMRATQ
jgi:hypothetical protein